MLRVLLTDLGIYTVEWGAGWLLWHLHLQHLQVTAVAFLQSAGCFSQISTFTGLLKLLSFEISPLKEVAG